jgi:hypothetical protein
VISLRTVTSPAGAGSLTAGDRAVAPRSNNYVATVTVSRRSPEDCGIRGIFVSVDGEEFAILGYPESVTKEIPAGPHRIRAHNTLFWKTHHLVLQPGEHARFTAINKAGWGAFGFLMVLGAAPLYLTFEREPPS